MNCDRLRAITGWHCIPAGTGAVRAVAPFTLGRDGRHATFYLAQPSEGTFYLTDGGESAMHAAQSGVDITKSRLDVLNKTAGVHFAHFGPDLAITASGPIDEAEVALWDAVKLAMSLSFSSEKWMPKLDHIRFRSLVEKTLAGSVGQGRIKTGYRVIGISGHAVEFPLALRSANDSIFLIEPIALLSGEKIDWGRVHQVYGKLADVKQADSVTNRVVVFEDGAGAAEFGRAATLLAQNAEITTLGGLPDWSQRVLAA
ncbi:DUF1828 domain-containing protein [Paraburkholderia edwinii]|uniref:DUF1828 domain-containing protein n=2 Tax=Paraburkholderia edwinii TaxID=2861782 RepID=A0ABX8UPY1_9BURK|nr:DUF1828 domain-containing protein [Paraburkholderia edwinii]QYD70357.1 DUF1828 domain-containing protein [Paraburkholderia edwinii]